MEQFAVRKENPLEYKPIGLLLVEFAVPATIAVLVNAVYNIVDQIFIGQGVGYLGNAATTVSFPVMTIVMAFATLIGSGGSAYAAIKLGQRQEEEAEDVLNNMFIIGLLSGILISAAGLIFLDPLLRLFGATDTIMPYARDYASIILAGVPASILGPCLSNMARTDGQPRLSMYGVLIGAVLNTILDPVYIFIFHWGVKGAAIATVTSQLISAAVLAWYFIRKGSIRLKLSKMKIVPRVAGRIVTLGMSSGVTQLVACLMQIVMNNSLVLYGNQVSTGGDVALSAMGIIMKLAMILASICIGIGIGSQAIWGYNYGAGSKKRVRDTIRYSLISAAVLMLVGTVVSLAIPDIILSMFQADAELMRAGTEALRLISLGFLVSSAGVIFSGVFEALGRGGDSLIISLLRQLVIILPLGYLLSRTMGAAGIWISFPVAELVSAVIACLLLKRMEGGIYFPFDKKEIINRK